MSTMLDILGSIIIGGMVILGMSQFILDRQAAVMESSDETTSQILNESTTSTLMSDLRKIAFNVDPPTSAIMQCTSTSLTARGDIDNNGVVDTIRWRWAGLDSTTANPSDILLFRRINSLTEQSFHSGIVSFRFVYTDQSGNVTTTPSMVRSISVSMATQGNLVRDSLPEAFSEFRISPRSLNK